MAQAVRKDTIPAISPPATGKVGKGKRKDRFEWMDSLFSSEIPLEMSITTDVRKYIADRTGEEILPATVELGFPGGKSVRQSATLQVRGFFRKEHCQIPSFWVDLRTQGRKGGHSGGRWKVVTACFSGERFDRLVWKEYLAYRICNVITGKSFRVRLLTIRFIDSSGKRKPFSEPGFLIEDPDDMAERNQCVVDERPLMHDAQTDRAHMTLMALFQYMIGNTDWAVYQGHNVKLIRDRKDTLARPFLIPYDFDFSGLVDAPYAVPDEQFGTTSVTTRVYRGYPRSMDELDSAISIFKATRPRVESLISGFEWLEPTERKWMLDYLSEFYRVIGHQATVRRLFVENARQ